MCCRDVWPLREEDPMLIEANAMLPMARVSCQALGPVIPAKGQGMRTEGSDLDELAIPATIQDGLAVTTEDCPSTPIAPPGFEPTQDLQEKRLEAFTMEVQLKVPAPLLPCPAKVKRAQPPKVNEAPELPKRSERLASHQLANVPSSKRAEVVLMQRFGVAPEGALLTNEGREACKKAYDNLYKDGLANKNFEAMTDLMPALKNASSFLGKPA
ncbi:unnamed protein product [Urochloa decumbens]|uniref:Uncharacterized protein n=1 Tax=Urochloa decumbens TaxID=240449 RepID=A0ABC8Z9E2_9POAL